MAKPILYSYYRSSASWRVRIALAYKGINYDYKAVHLVKDGGEQHSDAYHELNPLSQVPTLVIDGLTLTQSLPIIEYLDETRLESPLLPKDPAARAQARRVAEAINSGIQPFQNLSTLNMVREITGSEEKKNEWAKHFVAKGLRGVEDILKKTSGKFCIGDSVTMADACLVPQLHHARRFGVDLSGFPIATRIEAECEKLEAFQKAHASKQPDCPEVS